MVDNLCVLMYYKNRSGSGEMVDAEHLKCSDFGRIGSSPMFRTKPIVLI